MAYSLTANFMPIGQASDDPLHGAVLFAPWELMGMTELEMLKAKLAARRNVPGYADNVREIEKRIAELEEQAPSQ